MRRAILTSFALAALLRAQVSGPLDRITAVMRDYARGMTENQFDVQTRISYFDSAGKLRRSQNSTHRMEFTKGRFRGAEPSAESDWTSTLQITRAGRRVKGLEWYTDRGVWDPVFVFAPRAQQPWTYQTSTAAGGSMTISYQSSEACSTYEPTPTGWAFKDTFCGKGQVALDERAAVPLRTTFLALGLPLTSGKVVLQDYRNDADYRMVTMAGIGQPFLFPKSATGAWVFADHKIVVECTYTLHTGK